MTTPSIPASVIVNVTPNVIGAGGSGLDLNGLILTLTDTVPIGQVASFASASDVADYFGPLSTEAAMAEVYFAGFVGSNIRPALLLFMQYVESPNGVPPFLRGGDVSAMTVAQLQALGSGTLTFTVNGQTFTSGTINLAGATSFSNAAALITTGLANYDAVGTGSIAGTTLTITAVASGTYRIGQFISGSGVSSVRIAALGTGTGGTGTYTIEGGSQTVSSTTISAGPTTAVYDSQLGAFEIYGGTPGANGGTVSYATGGLSAGLKLSSTTAAAQSAGTDKMTPAGAMDAAVSITQNFACFTTTWGDPAPDDRVAFAAWTNGQNDRFLYAMWDDDETVATVQDDPATAGYLITAADYSGTEMIYDPTNGPLVAAFVLGWAASLDFAQTEGRTNLDLRSQAGLPAGVTSATARNILIANGYNFYGSFATANDEFTFYNPGSITGPFLWADSYVNQIWMNNAFQLALMVLLTNLRSLPYNAAGYGLIEAAMMDVVNDAVNFGVIRAGVPLSEAQAAQVNTAAGVRVSDTIEQRGWYIQVAPASAEVRQARGSPPVTFWYADGQSVQTINLASVEIA